MQVIVRKRNFTWKGTAYDAWTGDPATSTPTNHSGWTIKSQLRTRRKNELVANFNAAFLVATEGTFEVWLTGEQSCALPLGDYWFDAVATDVEGKEHVYIPAQPISVHDHPTDPGDNNPNLLASCTDIIHHTHEIEDVNGLQEALNFTYGWDEIIGKPTEFPPETHTHTWGEITGKPLTFTPEAHQHVEADITNLDKYTQAEVQALTDAVQANLDTHEGDSDNPHQTTFANLANKPDQIMVWKGEWTPGTSTLANEVYFDGGWTMIAIADTDDRPSPQNTGDPVTGLPVTPTFTTPSHTGLVRAGNVYTFTEPGFLTSIKARVPAIGPDIEYRFLVGNITDPANPIWQFTDVPPSVNDTDFFNIAVGKAIVKAGTKIAVIVQSLNSGSTTQVTGGWTYAGTEGGSAPASQQWNRRNQQDELRISYTDLDSVDRTGELNGIIAGSTIRMAQTSDPNNFYEYLVNGSTDMGTAIEYSVDLINEGGGGPDTGQSTTMTADIPVAAATDFVQEAGYWTTNSPLSFATVEGSLELSGVEQAATANLFGTDLVFQPASVSPDWDLVAYSGEADSSAVDEPGLSAASVALQGWGNYSDDTYDSGNKLTVNDARTKVTIDGLKATTDTSQLPGGAQLWDTATNKITPVAEGDTYEVRLGFKCEDGGGTPQFDVELDIGGGVGVILSETRLVDKDSDQRMVYSWRVFVGSTFLANGGEFYLDTTYDAVSVDFWDFNLFVERTYSGT